MEKPKKTKVATKDDGKESKEGPAEVKPSYIVPAVGRAMKIIILLKNENRDMSIAEIANATGWARSSIHKLLLTMNYYGLLDRDSRTKRYALGGEFAELSHFIFAEKTQQLRDFVKPYLKTLVKFCHETASLSVMRDTQIIFLDAEEPHATTRISLISGTSVPATATSNGKVILAWMPEERVVDIIRTVGLPTLSGTPIGRISDFLKELETVRETGYAIDSEEWRSGLIGISVPLFAGKKKIIGAISIVGQRERMKDKVTTYAKKCVEVSAEISKKIGN